MLFANINEYNRRKWVSEQLKMIPDGESVLDAGAGECQYKKYCQHLKYVSQDFCQYDGSGDKLALQTKDWNTSEIQIISDIINIPVENGYFDNILCTEVLEHVPYPDKAVREFSRILKNEGLLILTAPFCSQTHFSPFHFSTGFNIYWYKKIFEDNNLELIEYEANGNYFDYVIQELLRLPIMFKRYSMFTFVSLFLYIILLPIVFIIKIMSLFSQKSEKQMCFGYHIVARKK